MTIALWIAATLIVATALAGLAKAQYRIYRINRLVRSLRRGERGHITGGVALALNLVILLSLGLTGMTLYLAEDADDAIRDRIEALEGRPYTETSSIQITPTP